MHSVIDTITKSRKGLQRKKKKKKKKKKRIATKRKVLV